LPRILPAMQLIVITPETNIDDEAKLVNSLFENGLERLHVRKMLATTEEIRNYILEIDPMYHGRIVLNGSFELVNEFSLGGIHLSSFARNNGPLWEEIKMVPSSFMSTSFHSWEEVENNRFQYRYVFISPVFDSISKEGHTGSIDIASGIVIKQNLAARNNYYPKIIALGGIGVEQIPLVHKYGFDGAAMLGAIWMAENPVAKFIEAQKVARSLYFH
jgi:thiamine-phosphate pyrophosphorylase